MRSFNFYPFSIPMSEPEPSESELEPESNIITVPAPPKYCGSGSAAVFNFVIFYQIILTNLAINPYLFFFLISTLCIV
jgi:hypothetical protein